MTIYAIRIIYIEKILLIGTLLSIINAKIGQRCLLLKIVLTNHSQIESQNLTLTSSCWFILKRKKIFRSRGREEYFYSKKLHNSHKIGINEFSAREIPEQSFIYKLATE